MALSSFKANHKERWNQDDAWLDLSSALKDFFGHNLLNLSISVSVDGKTGLRNSVLHVSVLLDRRYRDTYSDIFDKYLTRKELFLPDDHPGPAMRYEIIMSDVEEYCKTLKKNIQKKYSHEFDKQMSKVLSEEEV